MPHLTGSHLVALAALLVALTLGVVLLAELPALITSSHAAPPASPTPATPGPAVGSVSTDGTWTTYPMPDNSSLLAISCPSAQWCLGSVEPQDGRPRPLFMLFNGTSWKAITSPTQASDEYADDVACPAVGFCIATSFGDHGYWIYSGGRWSSEGSLPFQGSALVPHVACSSPTFCMAVPLDGAGPEYAVYDGTKWSAGTYDAGVSDPKAMALDCSSARLCVMGVVGKQGSRLLTYDGTGWSVSNSTFAFDLENQLLIACTGDFCLAANPDSVMSYTNGEWSTPLSLPRAPHAWQGATSISCPVSGECYLFSIQGGSTQRSITERLETFSRGVVSKPVPSPFFAADGSFSCPTTSFCLMGDSETKGGGVGYSVYRTA